MTTRHVRAAWPILAIAFVFAGCDISVGDGNFSIGLLSGKATDQWTRTYKLASGAELEISNVNGLIDVVEGAGDVEVRAERTSKASSDDAARALLAHLDMREDVTPNHVRIEAKVPSGGGLRQSLEVKYHVRVPAGVGVKLETVNGKISLTGLSGRADADTTNGGVTATDLSGPVKVATVNGGVEIEVKAVAPDGIEMTAVNGGVRLRLPAAAKADLDASCTNGRVSVAGGLNLETSENSSRQVSGRLNGGGPRVHLETTNGGVHIAARE